MSRREFLARSAAVAAAVPASGALLGACANREADDTSGPGVARTLPRPDNPVEWPRVSEPVASDLPIEEGVLRIYTWPLYMKPSLIKRFEEETGIQVRVTEFEDQFEAVARLRTGTTDFDMVVGVNTDVLAGIIESGLAQPLNHDYLSAMSGLWKAFQSPFYDVGSRYTVPYMVWTSGLAWRNDVIPDDVVLERYEPYSLFWDERFAGQTHLLNGIREAIAMALLKNGIFDVNTENPAHLETALQDLLDLVDRMQPKFDHLDYRDMFKGARLHQSWSGNIAFMRFYAPEPSDMEKISYWWPPQGGTGFPGVVGSDTMIILKDARAPVAAHAFMDFLLDPSVALENTIYEGYRPPIYSIDAGVLIDEGILPPKLSSVLVSEADFSEGQQLLELSPAGAQLWDKVYEQVLRANVR